MYCDSEEIKRMSSLAVFRGRLGKKIETSISM